MYVIMNWWVWLPTSHDCSAAGASVCSLCYSPDCAQVAVGLSTGEIQVFEIACSSSIFLLPPAKVTVIMNLMQCWLECNCMFGDLLQCILYYCDILWPCRRHLLPLLWPTLKMGSVLLWDTEMEAYRYGKVRLPIICAASSIVLQHSVMLNKLTVQSPQPNVDPLPNLICRLPAIAIILNECHQRPFLMQCCYVSYYLQCAVSNNHKFIQTVNIYFSVSVICMSGVYFCIMCVKNDIKSS